MLCTTMQHVRHYASQPCSDLRCWHFTSLSLIHQPSRGGGGGEGETKDNAPLFFLSDPNPLFLAILLFTYIPLYNCFVCLSIIEPQIALFVCWLFLCSWIQATTTIVNALPCLCFKTSKWSILFIFNI